MSYLPLRISTIKPNIELTFDLYIYFKETYLKYTPASNNIEEDKYNKLKDQNVANFFIPEEQEDLYHDYLDKLVQESFTDPIDENGEKFKLAKGIAESAIEKMQQKQTEKGYNMTKKAARGFRSITKNNPQALKKLFGEQAGDADLIIKHSLNVCALSTKLAELCKLPEKDIEELSTASLIHDIGLVKMPEEKRSLFNKPKSEFSSEDKIAYIDHVRDSAKILAEKPYVTQEVENLILNHEENLQGTGPNKNKNLTKAQEIISMANAYDKKLLVSGKTPKEAINDFLIDEVGNYNLDLINLLKDLLKKEGLLD